MIQSQAISGCNWLWCAKYSTLMETHVDIAMHMWCVCVCVLVLVCVHMCVCMCVCVRVCMCVCRVRFVPSSYVS